VQQQQGQQRALPLSAAELLLPERRQALGRLPQQVQQLAQRLQLQARQAAP
jgi:hypothetical protein